MVRFVRRGLFCGRSTWSLWLSTTVIFWSSRSSAGARGAARPFAASSRRPSALSGTHTLSRPRRQCLGQFHQFIATEFAIAISIE